MIPISDRHLVDPETGIVLSRLGWTNRAGYTSVFLDGKTTYAHRVIWEAVHGAVPDGLTINHKNGVKTDNRIENLELATQAEQNQHSYDTGLRGRYGGFCGQGQASPQAKLTEEAVRAIRRSAESGTVLARRYGVTYSTIWKVRTGRAWTHVG